MSGINYNLWRVTLSSTFLIISFLTYCSRKTALANRQFASINQAFQPGDSQLSKHIHIGAGVTTLKGSLAQTRFGFVAFGHEIYDHNEIIVV